MREIEIETRLSEKQWLFYDTIEKKSVTLYGGAKGGGKSHGMRAILISKCLEIYGLRAVIFRRTVDELKENHIDLIWRDWPELFQYFHGTNLQINFPNGSKLMFRYCKREAEVNNYRGREYHYLGIEEAGDWTEVMYKRLRGGSNRTSIPGITPKCILTGNPGGIGHAWLKRLFITRDFRGGEKESDYAFVPARLEDNPAMLENDPEYEARLLEEPNEALRKAFRWGVWDIIAGQFFSLNREVHIVEPFDIPRHWNRFGAYDPGYNHPCCWLWFAVDEDGIVYLYRELVEAGLDAYAQAEKVLEFPESPGMEWFAGHDAWARKNPLKSTEPTLAEKLGELGISLTMANNDRIQGANQVRMFLRAPQVEIKEGEIFTLEPRFQIFSTCPITFDCLTRMIHNPSNAEDVLKVDATEGDPWTGDDPYDTTRYGLMSRPTPSDPIIHKVRDKWAREKGKDRLSWLTA